MGAILCNSGIAASRASLVLLLNNDVVFSQPHSLAAMLSLAQLEAVGCVGALLRYPDDSIQHLGVEMSEDLASGEELCFRFRLHSRLDGGKAFYRALNFSSS
jgi:GT2 family glycosyltransferase